MLDYDCRDSLSMTVDKRGQTTLDFTIGVTIFVVVLMGVFLFVPGTLEPFDNGNQEDLVTVERIADDLTQQSLAAPERPFILDDSCTVTFFEDPSSSPGSCRYSGSNTAERIGITDVQSVNISLRGEAAVGSEDPNILCWDSSNTPGSRLETGSNCAPSDTVLSVGDGSSGISSSVTARRVVELDGRDVFLVVELW